MILCCRCEVRAGPEYIIRKYTFFKNGTFLLLRYHYAEESCSIATHTVTIRGSIKLLGSSAVVSGATETRFHIDAINIVPLNRQVFSNRLNREREVKLSSRRLINRGDKYGKMSK